VIKYRKLKINHIINNIVLKYFVIVLCLISNIAWANLARPPEPKNGNILGQGDLQSISVLSEELRIDLSEVAQGGDAKIRAYYKIYSPTPVTDLELIFVANNLTNSRYLVEIDDQFVDGYIRELALTPSDSVMFKSNKIPFHYTNEGLIAFSVNYITAGEHTLEISYEANVAEWYESDELSITRAFVYILKPYEGWKEFRNLNLILYMPSGWEYTSNLEMESHPNAPHVTSGFWEELPAHHLAITFRPKEKGVTILSFLFVISCVLVFIFLSQLWMLTVIKFRLKKNRSKIIQIISDIFLSFMATVFFLTVYLFEPDLKRYLLDSHLNPFYTYGIAYVIFYFLIIWIISLIIILIVDYFLTKSYDKI